MNDGEAWMFVASCQRLIRWALFKHFEKRLAMLAFGTGKDAVSEVSLYIFERIKKRPQLTSKYKASTIVRNCVRWCTLRAISKELACRRGFDQLCSVADREEYQEAFEISPQDEIDLAMESLTWRERNILALRYGLKHGINSDSYGVSFTLSECGRIFKICRERVRSIEAKAIRKLQHPLRSKLLKSLVEQAV